MLLSYASKSVAISQRNRSRIARTGLAPGGRKIWTKAEDDRLRAMKAEEIGAARRKFPGRTEIAIRARRLKLGLSERHIKPWLTSEDRILREHATNMRWRQISELLPGRSRAAVQGRARYLGISSTWRGDGPKKYNIPLFDAIRQRAWEDGICLQALDRELKTGGYFEKNGSRRRGKSGYVNFSHIRKAVEFFGGTFTIDWQDI